MIIKSYFKLSSNNIESQQKNYKTMKIFVNRILNTYNRFEIHGSVFVRIPAAKNRGKNSI